MSRKSLRELRGDTRSMLGLNTEHIPPGVLDTEINHAQRILNMKHEILLSSWYATSVANKSLYKLPLDLLRLNRVYWDDTLLSYQHRRSLRDIEDMEDVQTPTWTEEV